MKFCNEQYAITKKYKEELLNKVAAFREENKIKSAINIVFVSTYGLKHNEYSHIIQNEVDMYDLMKE